MACAYVAHALGIARVPKRHSHPFRLPGLNHWIQQWGWRRSLHLLAREALLCLFESCDAAQAGQVVEALGGKRRVDDLVAMIALFGFIRIRGLYSQRLDACLGEPEAGTCSHAVAARSLPAPRRSLPSRISSPPPQRTWLPRTSPCA